MEPTPKNTEEWRRRAETPCVNARALWTWVEIFTDLRVPTRPVCPHHNAPFEYLTRAYFEPASDLVVWASRGGGKTRLGAIATLLDLMHKPGTAVRILGGSLEQSLKMWEHLRPDLENLAVHRLERAPASSRTVLVGGSSVAVLAQSQTAVRGQRVQKLRCDEAELFAPDIWQAAQLTTRCGGSHDGAAVPPVRGAIEALSTMHKPFGMMSRIVETATAHKIPILCWCVLDVLERCPPERECRTCPLWDECQGVAKTKCAGFFSIDDAIRMKQRVSESTWQSEMLCRRPSLDESVFPTFDPQVHRVDELPGERPALSLAMDFGFSAPFVCLWIAEYADGRVHVIDEYVQSKQTLENHLAHISTRPCGFVKRVCCDPAGAGRNDQTARSSIDVLRRHGYHVYARRSGIADGLEQIRTALRPASGPVRLFIHSRCTRLLKAMQSYHYAPGGSELPVKDGEHDHPIDALRYYFVNRGRGEVVVREY